jgi:guanylate cyclase
VRIGIDAGPAVAGVIGRRKFIYDLWGDTVNTASRMESHGLPGQIQVTERVAAALEDSFVLRPRGVVDVKGKGPMRTFLLTGPRMPLPAGAHRAAAGDVSAGSASVDPAAAGVEDLRP